MRGGGVRGGGEVGRDGGRGRGSRFLNDKGEGESRSKRSGPLVDHPPGAVEWNRDHYMTEQKPIS